MPKATGKAVLCFVGRETRRFVAPGGARLEGIFFVSVGWLVGAVQWSRRGSASCRGGTGLCDGSEPSGSAGPVVGERASRRHRNLDAADADAHERAAILSSLRRMVPQ